jgi:hypothetical protein
MPELIDPDGQHTWVAPETAEKLLEDGWQLLHVDVPASDPASEADIADADETSPPDDDDDQAPSAPATENPLGEMKLTQLIEHAEKIGVDAEKIATLRRPGASKADAIALINAHTAS